MGQPWNGVNEATAANANEATGAGMLGYGPGVGSGAHHCRPCRDSRTTEGYCPSCGIVSQPPVVVVGPEKVRQLTRSGYFVGGRQHFSSTEIGAVRDLGLRRAMRLESAGRLGSARDETDRRWWSFRRTGAAFDLTLAMEAEARTALARILHVRGGTAGLHNSAIDAALTFLILRRHHRPVSMQKMTAFASMKGVRKADLHRAVRYVKRHTGFGLQGPSYEESCWPADGRLPPRFVCALREKARLAASVPRLGTIPPVLLVAGIALGMGQHADPPAAGTSEAEICEIFSVTPEGLTRAAKAAIEAGLIA